METVNNYFRLLEKSSLEREQQILVHAVRKFHCRRPSMKFGLYLEL